MNLDDLKNLPTPPPVRFQTNITQPLLAKVKSEVDTRGHLPYCYALGLLEAAKDTIKETYADTEEEEEDTE